MQFVEKENCIARFKLLFRIEQGYILDDGINLIAVIENTPVLLLLNKIYFNDICVILFSKPLDGAGLSNLTGSLNNQWFSIRIILPLRKISIDFSLK